MNIPAVNQIIDPNQDHHLTAVRNWQIIHRLRKTFPELPKTDVLDYGSGTPTLAQLLTQQGCQTQAHDIRQPNEQALTQKYKLIIAVDVSTHFLSPKANNSPQKEMVELLDEQGTIIEIWHPWTAKHGGHHYLIKEHNLAWDHLQHPHLQERMEESWPGWHVPKERQSPRPLQAAHQAWTATGLKYEITPTHSTWTPAEERHIRQNIIPTIEKWWPNADQETIWKIINVEMLTIVARKP